MCSTMHRSITLALLLLLPQLALALQNEPRSFGKAKLLMSSEQVKAVFPQMKQAPGPADASAPALPLAVYTLPNQSIFGLKPCEVGFRFFTDKLYEITFDCGRSDNVVAVLQKKFGNPSQFGEGAAFWQSERTVVALNTRLRTFTFGDRQLNSQLQAAVLQFIISKQGSAQMTPGSPTPVAAP